MNSHKNGCLTALDRAELVRRVLDEGQFADALGLLAKTDAIDARLLAMTAATPNLAPSRPPSQEIRQIRELQAPRRNLVARRTAVQRKLLILANALVRNNRIWTPERP